jgi:hypothetical protein
VWLTVLHGAWLVTVVVRSALVFGVLVSAAGGRVFAGVPAAAGALVGVLGAALALVCSFLDTVYLLALVTIVLLGVADFVFVVVCCYVADMLLGFLTMPIGGGPPGVPLFSSAALCLIAAIGSGALCVASVLAEVFCHVQDWRAARTRLRRRISRIASSRSLVGTATIESGSPATTTTVVTTTAATSTTSLLYQSASMLFRQHRSKSFALHPRSVVLIVTVCVSVAFVISLIASSSASLGIALRDVTKFKTATQNGCEELEGGLCLLPWPSSQFLTPDISTATGFRVSIPPGAMPIQRSGKRFIPADLNELDGFATTTAVLFDLVGAKTLAFDLQGSRSTLPMIEQHTNKTTAKTAIIDVSTLELLPHFAELDAVHPQQRPLVILQPAVPMQYGRRYVAAVRGLVDIATLKTAPPAPGFERILKERNGERWEQLNARVLPIIAAALGWQENEL